MAVEITPLGFQKPDGNELIRNGDNVVAANAQKSEDEHQTSRGRLNNIEAKDAQQDVRLTTNEAKNAAQDSSLAVHAARLANLDNAAGFTGDPLALNDAAVNGLLATATSTRGSLDARFAAKTHTHTPTVIAVATDFDTLVTPGTYLFTQNGLTSPNRPNYPGFAADQAGHLVVEGNGSSLIKQTYTNYSSASEILGRVKYSGTWRAWMPPVEKATSTQDGLMALADKAKLDAASAAATANTLVMLDAAGRAKVATPSATTDIANKSYVDAQADIRARDGNKYAFIAGVIRNDGSPNYFQPLTTSTTHRPINIDSVTTDTSKIRINYPSIAGNMTISFLALPDETLAQAGFMMGCSVTPTYADIKMTRLVPPVADYVYYNGTTWVSQDNNFTGISFSGGKLHLDHKAIASDMTYSVSITPRGGTYEYSVSPDASPTGSTYVEIGVRDHAGNYVTTPTTGMQFYLTHGSAKNVDINPQTVDTVAYPLGNIWLLGIIGTA